MTTNIITDNLNFFKPKQKYKYNEKNQLTISIMYV